MELHSVFKDVVAYVEVRSGNDNRSAAIAQELRHLGARVEPTFTDAVTHVVFKEGLRRTWIKALKRKVHLVSVSWIDSCKQNQTQMPEKQFAAVLPEEISSPLPRIKQPVRWKKMKSMQPCDFNEELARSAERGEKKRKRLMASKFVLNEEVTPTPSSPIPVLAFETQARRSPMSATLTRVNSPIPDTPPSMQERLERMRREQKQVLDLNLDNSPPSTPRALTENVIQRRLYDLFTMDIMSTGSSNEEDEAASKIVKNIICSLDSNSERGSQPSADRNGITVLASEHSEDPCVLKSLVPETERAVTGSSAASSNDIFQTSQSSKLVSIACDRRASRASRMSSVCHTSTSSVNLDPNISCSNKSRSVNNSENKNRQSEPPARCYSSGRRASSMSNALSPKDLNVDTPTLNVQSLDLQGSLKELQPPDKSNAVKILESVDASFRSGRHLLEVVSEVDNNNCDKVMTSASIDNGNCDTVMTSASIDNVEGSIDSVSAELGQPRARRLSKRQSLVSGKSKPKSLISKELKQQPLNSAEETSGDLSSGFKSVNECMSARTCPVEFDEQTNKLITNSSPGALRGDVHKASTKATDGAHSSTTLKVVRKKRNLIAGAMSTAFSLSSVETSSSQKSPQALPSDKSKAPAVGSDIKSDISFMFGFNKSHDTKPKESKSKRRSIRLNTNSPPTSIDHYESAENAINCTSKKMLSGDRLCKIVKEGNCVNSYGQQNHSSFGESMLKGEMSMSMAYGHDTSTSNLTRVGNSRQSLDEFRTHTKTIGKVRKPSRLSVLKPKKTTNEMKNKPTKPHGNAQQNKVKRKHSLSPSNNLTSSMGTPAKRRKGCDLLQCPDVDRTLSESSQAEDDQAPAQLRHAHSLLMEQKCQAPSKRSPYSLVVTSLHRDEQETVYAVVKRLGIFHMTNNVEPTTTHVVCGESRRTLNLLRAIASGCWLLKKEWVLESLEAGTWLQEEAYEMTDIQAAVKSRCERQKVGPSYKVDLFSKCGPIFVSSVCTPPRNETVHLINLCCGQVTGSESRAAIHIGDDHNPRKLVIKPLWVLDCIMKLETLPTDGYIVFPTMLNSHRENSPEF
ncbi:hypothetical protein BsWGS_02431 [Bradybaena similaris]